MFSSKSLIGKFFKSTPKQELQGPWQCSPGSLRFPKTPPPGLYSRLPQARPIWSRHGRVARGHICPDVLRNVYDNYQELNIGRNHIKVWISVFFPHKNLEGPASLGPNSRQLHCWCEVGMTELLSLMA